MHYLLSRIIQARLDNMEVWQVSCQMTPLAGSWAYVSSKGSPRSIRMYGRLTYSVTRHAFDLVLANWLHDKTVIIVPLFWLDCVMALNLTSSGILLFLNPNFVKHVQYYIGLQWHISVFIYFFIPPHDINRLCMIFLQIIWWAVTVNCRR